MAIPIRLGFFSSSFSITVIERDYIMRMITMLTQVIAKLVDIKRAKDFPEGIVEIERGCKSILGMGSNLLNVFSDDQLVDLLGKDPELSISRWYILGVLLKEKGALLRAMENPDEAVRTEVSSLNLLLQSYLGSDVPIEPNHEGMIIELIDRFEGFNLPLSLLEKLPLFYERTRRYAEAENVHYDILDQSEDHGPTVQAFYERLMEKSDEELERGGLPRTEVLDGLAALKQRRSQGNQG